MFGKKKKEEGEEFSIRLTANGSNFQKKREKEVIHLLSELLVDE